MSRTKIVLWTGSALALSISALQVMNSIYSGVGLGGRRDPRIKSENC